MANASFHFIKKDRWTCIVAGTDMDIVEWLFEFEGIGAVDV